MGLQKQTAHMPLTKGVDTKSDPRALAAPKMARLENAVFDEIGGFRKRPGMEPLGLPNLDSGGSPSTIDDERTRAVAERDDELVLFAEGRAYTWSPASNSGGIGENGTWLDRGRFESVLVDQKSLLFDRADQVLGDRAEAENLVMVAWYVPAEDAVKVQVIDKSTGSTIPLPERSFATARTPRVRAVGGNLHCYFYDSGATALKVFVVDPGDITSLSDSAVVVDADATGGFDVCDFDGLAVVAYGITGNNVKVAKMSSAGAITASRDTGRDAVSGAAEQKIIAIDYNPTALKFGVVRVITTGTDDEVYFDWLKSDLTDDGANVNFAVGSPDDNTIMNAGVLVFANNTAHVFHDEKVYVSAVHEPMLDRVYRHNVTATGTITTRVLARRCKLGSRPALWVDGSTEREMVHVLHGSPQQSAYFLLDAAHVVGEINGSSASTDEVGILARVSHAEGPGDDILGASDGGTIAAGFVGHLPQIESLGEGQFASVLSFRRAFEERTVGVDTRAYSERGLRQFVYTFADSRAYRGVQEGRALYLPGGYLAMYDGKRVVESGFLLWTEGITYEVSDTGGNIPSQVDAVDVTVLSYRFYWEWINAAGELERSTHAGSININVRQESTDAGGPTNTNLITFTVPVLPFTNKTNVVLAVYRCISNDPTAFYRISSVDPTADTYVTNDVNADTIEFVDEGEITDAELIFLEPDYLNGEGINGTVQLDNVAPPATRFVAAGQGRLFTCDPEDRSLLRHSKIRLAGDAVAFHDSLTCRLPQEGGDATAVEVTDGAIIAWKEHAIFVVSGQGPDNLGSNPYPSPQRVVAGIGCDEIRSVARYPGGHIFHSAKGFYALDPAYNVSYVGAGVEDYNSLSIRGALCIADKHRIQFVASTTGQLVYDYLVGEWSVWTGRSGISATMWQDTPIHLETSTGPWKQVATFSDNGTGFALLFETAWLKMADLQGSQRVWWVSILGAYRSEHVLNVEFAYDYVETFDAPKTFTPSGLSAGARLQARFEPRVQTGEAMKLRVSDSQDGAADWREALSLTGISFEYGVEPNTHKSGALNTK